LDYGLDNSSKKYIWQGDYNEQGIKPIIQFSYRGLNGSFWIGINFKFIPFITRYKALRFYSYNPHLFESKSYFDRKINISLWNENFFRKSLQKYFDKNLEDIIHFLKRLNSVEANIEMAKRQIESDSYVYRHRFPDQEFVLIHLLNKVHQTENIERLKTIFLDKNKDYDNSIFRHLD
jgi:hypothetical protein